MTRVAIALALALITSACSGAAGAPCGILPATEVAAALGVESVRSAESPIKGAGRICNYYVPGGWRADLPQGPALKLFITDAAVFADDDRGRALLGGQRELELAGVDRATIFAGEGGVSAGVAMVKGDRTARLHFYVRGQSQPEQERILVALAKHVVDRWLSPEID